MRAINPLPFWTMSPGNGIQNLNLTQKIQVHAERKILGQLVVLLEITKAKRESFFPCYQWCAQNASNYFPLVYLPWQRGARSKAYLVHWVRLEITSVTCFDHDLHSSGGSLGANLLPLPWGCPLHSPALCWHTLPFPCTLPCTRWTVLNIHFLSSFYVQKPMMTAYQVKDTLSSLPIGASVISTLESLGFHCWRAWAVRSGLASLLSSITMPSSKPLALTLFTTLFTPFTLWALFFELRLITKGLLTGTGPPWNLPSRNS